MRNIRIAGLSLLAVVIALFAATPALAVDNNYVTQVVTALQTDPLYVDAKATPAMSADHQTEIRSLIASTGRPYFVILMDAAKRGDTAVADLPKAYHDAMAGTNPQAVIIVLSNGKLQADGFNLPAAVAAKLQGLANTDLNGAGLTTAITNFINHVNAIPTGTGGSATNTQTGTVKPGPASTGSVAPPVKKANHTGLIIGIVVFLVILAVAATVIGMAMSRRRPRSYASDTNPFAGGGYGGNGTYARNDAGERIHVSPSVYVAQPMMTPRYSNYYPGGMWNGQYYGAGYYQDPFWNWVMWDSMMHDHDRGYGHHDSTSRIADADPVLTAPASSDGWADTRWGGNGSDSGSGGGSVTQDDPEPSYSPPAYAPPSYDPPSTDWGGGGGGFDSGSGGGSVTGDS